MKDYCTQNNGDCKTCSLSNYGRDCENNPIEDETNNNLKGVKLENEKFYFEKENKKRKERR